MKASLIASVFAFAGLVQAGERPEERVFSTPGAGRIHVQVLGAGKRSGSYWLLDGTTFRQFAQEVDLATGHAPAHDVYLSYTIIRERIGKRSDTNFSERKQNLRLPELPFSPTSMEILLR